MFRDVIVTFKIITYTFCAYILVQMFVEVDQLIFRAIIIHASKIILLKSFIITNSVVFHEFEGSMYIIRCFDMIRNRIYAINQTGTS